MERIWLIVDQIEEAKKLLNSDKFSFLRMSLLLLDNAAEVLMYRKILDEFTYDEFHEKLNENAKGSLPNDVYEQWRQQFNIHIIGAQKKKRINKFFDEKVKFLSEDKDYIKKPVAKVLMALHRYRNEAYHRDNIRKETLRPVVCLLFEIVSDLLVELPPSSYVYSGGEDWNEYFSKYELPVKPFLPDNGMQLISDNLKAGVSMDFITMKDSLKTHIKNRIEDTLSNIEFIMRDGFRIDSLEETLKRIQFIQEKRKINMLKFDDELRTYIPKYSMSNFVKWSKKANEFEDCIDKYDLFNALTAIEEEFETIEKKVQEAAIELDNAIQMQIDIMRGK